VISLVGALSAAGEPTRLRILALLSQGELAVGELAAALDQSQPRVSRHVRLLTDSALLQRTPEGAWVFCRLAAVGTAQRALADAILAMVDRDDPLIKADLVRLAEIRAARDAQAAAYFERVAPEWKRLRSLHQPEAAIEAAMLTQAGPGPFQRMVDIGVGTGRMLNLFAERTTSAIGIDASREMLAIARAEIGEAAAAKVELRCADAYRLPIADGSADLVTVHQVLHYLADPDRAVAEAARILAPGGILLIADFAPHAHEFLRAQHAHRRLGFTTHELSEWCAAAAGAPVEQTLSLAPEARSGGLTVQIWKAVRPMIVAAEG
jgi:ArsR family transcriptional regulator